MTPKGERALKVVRKHIDRELADLDDSDYVELLEEVEADCAAKVRAKHDEGEPPEGKFG